MKIAINTSALYYSKDVSFDEFLKLGEVVFFGEVSRQRLKEICADVDAVIVNKVEVDEDLLNACPNIKYVGTFATGYNVVDINACNKRGITVCNVPDYSTHPVSQHTFALILALLGKTAEYNASVKAGDWIKSKTFCYFPYATSEIYGKTFGIFGYGNIGGTVAKIAESFGAKVIVCTRTPSKCPYETVEFDELLKRSDILSLHCPLTESTKNLINGRALSLMKKSAYLINTARGGLIDEAALAKALNSGKLAGAGVDTVSSEPMLADNPLYGAKNIIITPHIGWTPLETRMRLIRLASENLKAYIEGRPVNVVNK